MTRTIVGIDGSDHSIAALQWAADYSVKAGTELMAVFGWSFFDQGYHPPGARFLPEFTEQDANKVLDTAVDRAGLACSITKQAKQADAPEALASIATQEDLIVVGARGLGGFQGLLLGSVSTRILELAPCPVVVIHEDTPRAPRSEVVVGVDGSEESKNALHWAAQVASAQSRMLRIVHAWQLPIYDDVFTPAFTQALEEAAHQLVSEAADESYVQAIPHVTEVICAGAAHALLSHDGQASLIVVASRGLGKWKRLLLGSTSRQVVQHAQAPVAVIPTHPKVLDL